MRGQMTHLDTDVLAEFRAGLITGRHGARIAAHLAGCDRCTAVDDQLAGVSALLASVPAPAMPGRVAQRLDTVLTAEVARRDNPERAAVTARANPPRPAGRPATAVSALDMARARPGRGRRGAGGGRVRPEPDRPRPAEPELRRHGSRRRAVDEEREVGRLPRHAAAAAPTKEAGPVPGAAARPLRMTPANFVVTTSSTDFARATFKQQVEADLRGPPRRARRTPRSRRCAPACAGWPTATRCSWSRAPPSRASRRPSSSPAPARTTRPG